MAGLPFAALVLCLHLTAGESQFTIIVEHSQINVTAGGDAFFSVRPSSSISSGSWTFNEKTIAQWIGQNRVVDHDYAPRAELLLHNGSLLLKSVNVSDSGEYGVNMVPTSGSQTSATVTLRVIAKPDDNSTPGPGAIVGIVLGLVGMGLIGGVSGWLIARKTGRVKDPPQSQYDTSINSGRQRTLDTNTGNASGTYENFSRNEQGVRNKAEDGSSTYMGLVLDDRSVYGDLKR